MDSSKQRYQYWITSKDLHISACADTECSLDWPKVKNDWNEWRERKIFIKIVLSIVIGLCNIICKWLLGFKVDNFNYSSTVLALTWYTLSKTRSQNNDERGGRYYPPNVEAEEKRECSVNLCVCVLDFVIEFFFSFDGWNVRRLKFAENESKDTRRVLFHGKVNCMSIVYLLLLAWPSQTELRENKITMVQMPK